MAGFIAEPLSPPVRFAECPPASGEARKTIRSLRGSEVHKSSHHATTSGYQSMLLGSFGFSVSSPSGLPSVARVAGLFRRPRREGSFAVGPARSGFLSGKYDSHVGSKSNMLHDNVFHGFEGVARQSIAGGRRGPFTAGPDFLPTRTEHLYRTTRRGDESPGEAVKARGSVSGLLGLPIAAARVDGARLLLVARVACCLQVLGVVDEAWAPRGWLLPVDRRGVPGPDAFVGELTLAVVALEDDRPELLPFPGRRRAAGCCPWAFPRGGVALAVATVADQVDAGAVIAWAASWRSRRGAGPRASD